jgi:hypothetical protein
MPFNQTGRISRAIVAVAGKSFRLADYFSGLLMDKMAPSTASMANFTVAMALRLVGNFVSTLIRQVIRYYRPQPVWQTVVLS